MKLFANPRINAQQNGRGKIISNYSSLSEGDKTEILQEIKRWESDRMDLPKEVMDLKREQAEIGASTKSAHKRIDTLENEVKDITRLTIAVEKIADKTENIDEKVDGLSCKIDNQDKRVTDIERKPAKRWNDAIDTIIKLAIGGIISYLFVRAGLGG